MDDVEVNLQRTLALKARIDALRPLGDSTLKALRKSADVELTWSSNAIEGNTLTLRETAEVIEHGITVGGKPLRDHLEAQDHAHALKWVYALAGSDEPITERVVRQIHQLVLARSAADIAGRYTTIQRGISGSEVVFPGPLDVPILMDGMGRTLMGSAMTPDSAFEAHRELVTIHPFTDGNGRTARLLMNLMLVRGGFRPVAIRPADRIEYLDGLEAGQLRSDHLPFRRLMHRRLKETMSEYLEAVSEAVRTTEAIENETLRLGSLHRSLNGRIKGR